MADAERREAPEIKEGTLEGQDTNGDRWRQRERYRESVDARTGEIRKEVLWAHGKIIEGPSKGHEWVKGSSGTVKGSPERVDALGQQGLALSEFKGGRWGVVLKQGENPTKPAEGSSWFHGEARAANPPAPAHERSLLTGQLPPMEPDPTNPRRTVGRDAAGREYSLRTTERGETIVEVTTPHDGYRVTTGRKLTEKPDPQTGESAKFESYWESWRVSDPALEPDLGVSLETEDGTLTDTKLRGFSRDLAITPSGEFDTSQQGLLPLHLEMGGRYDWNAGRRELLEQETETPES